MRKADRRGCTHSGSTRELEEGCALAIHCNLASVCILPYYLARCAESGVQQRVVDHLRNSFSFELEEISHASLFRFGLRDRKLHGYRRFPRNAAIDRHPQILRLTTN